VSFPREAASDGSQVGELGWHLVYDNDTAENRQTRVRFQFITLLRWPDRHLRLSHLTRNQTNNFSHP